MGIAVMIIHLTMKITLVRSIIQKRLFTVGCSIVKNVNGYLLTKKLQNKKLIPEFNPGHLILHVETNEFNNSKAASQISRSVIDIAQLLKSGKNPVASIIVWRYENLNSKVHEANSRVINMCRERDITFVDHTDTISIERYLNESKVHLSQSGKMKFAKNVCQFLLQQD